MDKKELQDPLKYIPKYLKVLTKPDERGRSQLVPMNLYPAQKYWIENRTNKDIILKPRQIRISTAIMAVNAHSLFTIPYCRMALVTHHDDVSQFLFQTIDRFYNNLPENMKPKKDWSSGARMRFPILDSFIHIDSAESKTIGFGESLTHAHLSEVSRWPANKADELFAGITQTVGANGYVTVESNPRGRLGLFYSLCQAAKRGESEYKYFFFPWWWEPEYRLPIQQPFKPIKEEQILMNQYGLDPEQIQFRRNKIIEFRAAGNEGLFYQEYPENDVDCWLSSEISVFDGMALKTYLMQIKEGRQEGNLTIWKDVIGGEKYVIGVDVAGGKAQGDYSVAAVLNVKRNEYVARLRGRIPPDLFAQDVLRLGYRYNEAQIGVERTGHGHLVLRTLLENNYPDIYYHLDYDSVMGVNSSEPGWKTSIKTKPIMVSDIAAALRSGDLSLWSENFLNEASAMTWEGQEKVKTPSGGFDDEVDALMIALQLRTQAPIAESIRYKPVSYVRI